MTKPVEHLRQRSCHWLSCIDQGLHRRSHRVGKCAPPRRSHLCATNSSRESGIRCLGFRLWEFADLNVSRCLIYLLLTSPYWLGQTMRARAAYCKRSTSRFRLPRQRGWLVEGIAWQKDKFELSFNPAQLLYSPGADVLSLATGGALQEPRQSQIEIELDDEIGNRCIVGLRRGRNRNIAVSIAGRQIGERLMDLTQPFTVYAPGLAGIPKEERYLSPGVVRRIVARGDANLTLRNVLRMLRADAAKWDAFVEDMQSIFGDISVDIEFDENTDEWIQVYFRFAGGPRLQVDAAGTSVLQASQILAYIALFQPQVLILDEPNSHLHPDNQRALCNLIFRLATTRGIPGAHQHAFEARPRLREGKTAASFGLAKE